MKRNPLAHWEPLDTDEMRRLSMEASSIYVEDGQREAYKFRRLFGRERLRSPRAFLEAFCWIKDVTGKLVPFKLNGSQRYVLAQLLKRGRRDMCWVDRKSGKVRFRREGRAWREVATDRIFNEIPSVQRPSMKPMLGPISAIVLKARQLGISTLIQGLIFEAQVRGDNVSAKLVSSLDQSAREVFEMQLRFVDTFGGKEQDGVVQGGIALPVKGRSESNSMLTFDAPLGGKLTCDSAQAKADPGRGGTYQVCHFTEVGEWPRDRETLLALDQVLHIVPGTMKVLESTARGARGEFYTLWKAAEKGVNDYVPIFLPWFMRPDSWSFRITDEERAKLIADLDNPRFGGPREESFLTAQRFFKPGEGWVKVSYDQLAWRRWWIANKCQGHVDLFHQEYPAFPEEAFLSTGRPVFDQRLLQTQLKRVEEQGKNWLQRGDPSPVDWNWILRYVDIDEHFSVARELKVDPNPAGPLIVWQRPLEGTEYIIGVDVAEGVQGGDYSTVCVISATSGELVASYRDLCLPTELARVCYRLGRWYNDALTAVEKNNHGYTTLVHMLDPLMYPNMYQRMQRTLPGSPSMDQFGWRTDPTSRRSMFHLFRTWFMDNSARIPWLQLLHEMQGMRYTDTGREDHPDRDSRGDRAHDDCVVAMAIALAVRDEAIRYEWVSSEEPVQKTESQWELDEFEALVATRQMPR